MTYRRLLLTAAATSLALAACNQKPAGPVTGAPIASLPLAQAAPPPLAVAPAANALPPAPPLPRVAHPRRPVYAYVDEAYQLANAFADSPPDYTIDYDGERPYVWRATDGQYRVVEETPDGQREYFYRGDSDYPFLVRDSRYAYAYDDGELVEVYDSYGRPYPNYDVAEAEIAARYLHRARRLYDAALHQKRQAAYAADWRERRDAVLAPQQVWAVERERNPDWRRIHDERVQREQPQQQAAWQRERAQRQAYAVRTAPLIAAAPQAPRRDFGRNFAGDGVPADALRRQQAQPAPQGRFQPQPAPPQVQAQQQAQAQAAARAQADIARRAQEAAQAQAAGQARDQQRAQAEAANRARGEAQRQQQMQAHDQQQHAQTEAAQRQQQAQQRAQAQALNQARQAQAAAQQRQAQAPAQAQQRAQAEAANRARGEAQRQQQMQAHDQQQRAQEEAAQHQQQAQQRAQAQAANQARQAQTAVQQHQAHAQQRQLQAQAAAQKPQADKAQAAKEAAQRAAGAGGKPQDKDKKREQQK